MAEPVSIGMASRNLPVVAFPMRIWLCLPADRRMTASSIWACSICILKEIRISFRMLATNQPRHLNFDCDQTLALSLELRQSQPSYFAWHTLNRATTRYAPVQAATFRSAPRGNSGLCRINAGEVKFEAEENALATR